MSTASRDAAALAWVGTFKCNTIFKLVLVGGTFRMNADTTETYTKTSDLGWYKDNATGRKYRTGVRTAVYVAEVTTP